MIFKSESHGRHSSLICQRLIFAALLMACSPLLMAGQLGSRAVLLDNDSVQVVRLSYPPGSESGVHGHDFPHRVVYVEQGGTLQFISGSGDDIRELSLKSGSAVFVPAATHNVRNIGETEVILVETELK